ncbi:hypothetical protein A1O1_02487 [Capronia coronata CBS 617.96]|uniref:DUF7924 domain-containing protein n=1 Tax=Capronia coronata CBS 617.96 TaxID=1182541 RepID=W9ZHX6_9EURO|nr:uncharacterized protein A1O1_02487 [Capronia coronata CBS 617.96]EXJ94094.1 hypothetical protein A1O1_02487 [Capronia coronata CBS 617.96]
MPDITRPTMSVSRHRRQTSSTSKSDDVEGTNSFGASGYRSTTLEPNNIIVEDEQMDDDRWCRLAFALGMPFGDVRRPSPEATRFAHQVRVRESVSGREMKELLAPLIFSVVQRHKLVNCSANNAFHQDSVPDGVTDFTIEGGWKTQLPTPRPAFALGYSSRAFTSHQLELQHGIISNSKNEPCDLHKLSQPVPDVYWPFVVVEIQGDSMLAARNACAGSAATCNNALMTFAGAAQQPLKHYRDVDFLWGLSKAAQSFSLAINGKTACLNTHNSEGCLPHAVAVIRTYRLDDDRDVEAMAARIRSILIWAENCRLRSITDLLHDFDLRVQLAKGPVKMMEDSYTPLQLTIPGRPAKKRRGVIKSVLAESLPRWAREF